MENHKKRTITQIHRNQRTITKKIIETNFNKNAKSQTLQPQMDKKISTKSLYIWVLKWTLNCLSIKF
jgi:hypothetical protein